MKKFFLYIWILTLLQPLFGINEEEDKKDKDEPPKVGNFALDGGRLPGALISFGGNILDKGQTQIFMYADTILGKDTYLTDYYPNILYGITDNFSIFINFPFSPANRIGRHRSYGFHDIFVQFEYAFYSKTSFDGESLATIVASINFPTGSVFKDPVTGYGATSYFLGTTFNRTTVDWLIFSGHGIFLTTERRGIRVGNSFLYQYGIGRHIAAFLPLNFAWVLELDGYYTWKTHVDKKLDPNTGGNLIYLTPSLWIGTEKSMLQLGIGYAVGQNFFGMQPRRGLIFALNFGIIL